MAREYSFDIPAMRGLDPWPRTRRNTMYNHDLINARVVEDGVESLGPPLLRALIPGLGETWPFPQPVVHMGNLYLFGQSKVYRLRKETKRAVQTIASNIAHFNHPWSFGQIGRTLYAGNARTVVEVTPKRIVTVHSNDLSQWRIPVATTMTAWGTRVWCGDYWAYGKRNENKVIASRMGVGDMRDETDDGSGAFSIEMEHTGRINAILGMNGVIDGVIVGGRHGVEFAYPRGHFMATRVVTDKVGVFGPKALVGHEDLVAWLGTDFCLYQWDGRGVENRGYQKHLKANPNICPVLSLNRATGDIHIGW